MGRVYLLGTRGSMPVSGVEFSKYGGATTCALVSLANEWILIDAGTGILKLPTVLPKDVKHLSLLISHTHLDHIQGLALCLKLFDPTFTLDIYIAPHGALSPREQLGRLFSPPLWPIKIDELPATVRLFELPKELTLGSVLVRSMEGNHPGGASMFRLEGEGKAIAFFTDCSLQGELLEPARSFANEADLLLCDGQYSDSEWEEKKRYGHNTWNMAADFARLVKAKKLRIIHHDPFRTDEEIDIASAGFGEACGFSHDMEVIDL